MPPQRRSRLGRRTATNINRRAHVERFTSEQIHTESINAAERMRRLRAQNTGNDNMHLTEFYNSLTGLSYKLCTQCSSSFLENTSFENTCSVCKKKPQKYSEGNNMQPGIQPEQLANLTQVEQMLISRVQPVLRV